METCSNPGCDQPGTNKCSACKTIFYCGPICQTADWTHHKEECQGHLRKVGKANLSKANGFHQQQNWVQALRYAKLAATKLKQLKDRRLETVEAINDALICKYDALQFTARHKEALECIKECYTLWAMNHMRNPGSIYAALLLIQSCLHNGEYEDAERYARHAYFMIAEMTDNFIPADQQPQFLADVSYFLASYLDWHKLVAFRQKGNRKRGRRRLRSHVRRWRSTRSCIGQRATESPLICAYLPTYWTTSTMSTTTRSFVFTSNRKLSIVEWNAVRR